MKKTLLITIAVLCLGWIPAANAGTYTLSGRIMLTDAGINGLPAGKTITDLTAEDTVIVTSNSAQIWFKPQNSTINCNLELNGLTISNEKTGKFRLDTAGHVLTGKVTLRGNTLIGATSTGTLKFSGQITGTGAIIYGTGNGSTITLENTSENVNDYTGNTVLGNLNGHGGPWGVSVVLNASEQISDAGNLVMNAFTGGARGALNLNGFNESVNGLVSGTESTNAAEAVIFNNSATASVLTLGVGNAADCVYSGKIGAGGMNLSINKVGTGTQTLTGDLTYTGATTVTSGILTIKPNVTLTSAATVNGGRLNFEGTLGSTLTVNAGGVFSPGVTTGAATVNDLVLNGDLVMDIVSADAFDSLEILGNATYGEDSRVVVNLYRPTGMETLNLTLLNAVTGNENWVWGENAYYWQNMTLQDGKLKAEVNMGAIPEPSTWILLVLGAAGLLCLKKRR